MTIALSCKSNDTVGAVYACVWVCACVRVAVATGTVSSSGWSTNQMNPMRRGK